jgi:hypothetical protein
MKNLPACEDGIECTETPEYIIQMLGNYPDESTQEGFTI